MENERIMTNKYESMEESLMQGNIIEVLGVPIYESEFELLKT